MEIWVRPIFFVCENKFQSVTSLTGGHSGKSDLVKCYKGFLNHNIDILKCCMFYAFGIHCLLFTLMMVQLELKQVGECMV